MYGHRRYLRRMAASDDHSSDPAFAFIGGRLWLNFVNTDDARLGIRTDTIASFERFVDWLRSARVLDADRADALRRRGAEQPSGAAAALVEARRVRAALRSLAERGRTDQGERTKSVVLVEINRVLGRSVGTRRVEALPDGGFLRSFVPVGDLFGGLIIPVVESAVDSLVLGELPRIHQCADRRCPRYFVDLTRSHTRRWCDMRTCGNRAKALRWRGQS